MLSCGCDFDSDNVSWWYDSNAEFAQFTGRRATRCKSCGNKINHGDTVLTFERFKYSDFGDEIDLADWHLCESCGEIYLNLTDIGYCCQLGTDLREDLKDYWDLTGFKSANAAG